MFVKNVALAALLVGSVYAQDSSDGSVPSGTSSSPVPSTSLSPCILSCATGATECTYTDASCVCSNTTYQGKVLACLQANCTPAEVQQAEAIEAALCSSSSSSVSSKLSSVQSSASSVLSSLSKTSTPTNTGSTSSGTGGATGLSAGIFATGCAVLLGVIGGGMLVF